ncbi:MAG: site-specific DNA-methyltransferase [Chloroflexi bacterium]|nr:site-specific DNA-methyltransferase [Chloroflexota bacterium]
MPKLVPNQIIPGNCIDVLAEMPAESVDLIFADPPYNLQLRRALWRPDQSKVEAVNNDWDKFTDFQAYDQFTEIWLNACKRVLKPTGTLWVIGSYHNIHRVGTILQNLGFWTLNEIAWVKVNPMPNFRGVRFANAHESLLWVQKKKGEKYIFNHHAMKALNGEKQMRSDWLLPICKGPERIRVNGETAHPTQKPEALLYRVITSSSNPGDIVLDPFFGTGTTGAVAKRLHRHWIGIEQDPQYIKVARNRIDAVQVEEFSDEIYVAPNPRKLARVPFGRLIEAGLLQPGQSLYFRKSGKHQARVTADGMLEINGERASIHTFARKLTNGAPANGWDYWFYENEQGERLDINNLREEIRKRESEKA